MAGSADKNRSRASIGMTPTYKRCIMKEFSGYHSEWNLGSPGGWDYQRLTQIIGKAVWHLLEKHMPCNLDLDFDHPLLFPVEGFTRMLVEAHRYRAGRNAGFIAIIAEEETLDTVTENKNLAQRLNSIEGITGRLAAPQELELKNGAVCLEGRPVSVIFMDFNTDVLLSLHRKHGLDPLIQAVRENRVINPRGTEPINIKSMFEVITGPLHTHFHREIVRRTPWTRQFFDRSATGPKGEHIKDIIEWTRTHWNDLVLKPERGYSGKGVKVGGINSGADEAIKEALREGGYIVQEKIPVEQWSEDMPEIDEKSETVALNLRQTDFRSLFGPEGLFGFLGRYGGVPTNVGSGGGVQSLAVIPDELDMRETVQKMNETILTLDYRTVYKAVSAQKKMAVDHEFTYLHGPIRMALRPRLVSRGQLVSLEKYCRELWLDCLTLEKMWRAGELDSMVKIEEEELEIARAQPWNGGPAIIASDGLFNFGAARVS